MDKTEMKKWIKTNIPWYAQPRGFRTTAELRKTIVDWCNIKINEFEKAKSKVV